LHYLSVVSDRAVIVTAGLDNGRATAATVAKDFPLAHVPSERTTSKHFVDGHLGGIAMNSAFRLRYLTILAGIAATAVSTAAPPVPFKITNIHFETNASACDMGIQISFDTDGLTEGAVIGPRRQTVFEFESVYGWDVTHNVTEVFQERVEPPIIDLEYALGCEPRVNAIPLGQLLQAWPAGTYRFKGRSSDEEFLGQARLTHKVPAGPEIISPSDGEIVSADAPLLVQWKPVTKPILPQLGPVQVVGYHALVVDVTLPVLPPGKTKTSLDADLSAAETTFVVPKQYLEPNRIYELEILATEKDGNQTITEGGVFCTAPITAANCKKP
jgi:hypothetical protein